MQSYLQAWKRGETSYLGGYENLYDARNAFNEKIWSEYKQNPENENKTFINLMEEYPEVNEFFEEAKKMLPPEFQDVFDFGENVLNVLLKENPSLNVEKHAITAQLFDMFAEANISDISNPQAKDKLINKAMTIIKSNLGVALDKNKKYSGYFGEGYVPTKTLENYKVGVFGGEDKTAAAALYELEHNPQLVYTNQDGVVKIMGTPEIQKGINSVESYARNMTASFIKQTTGEDVKPGSLGMDYEAEGTNDLAATFVLHYKGTDYRVRSEDGKNIIFEQKKNGVKDWQQIKTPNRMKYEKQKKDSRNSGTKKYRKLLITKTLQQLSLQ